MNIFATSSFAREAAKHLDDKRLIKMCLETTQIVCTIFNKKGFVTPYKSTHINHPCVKWVGNDFTRFSYLINYWDNILRRYELIYKKEHSCRSINRQCFLWGQWVTLFNTALPLTFVNCARNKSLGIDYTHITDVHLAYKLYLINRWLTDKRKPTWKRIALHPFDIFPNVDYENQCYKRNK